MAGVTFNTATTNLASECITWAEDEIRKYLSTRYDLSADAFQTSTSTPPIVKSWCTRLAVGYTEIQLARGGKEAIAMGESKVNSILKNLEMVSSGDLSIADSTGSLLPEGDASRFAVTSNTSDFAPTFAVDTATAWSIDSDRLDSIEDARD